MQRLLEIMSRLRDPVSGCPWDVKQDFATVAPYTIEEAYEVADAIEQGDHAALKEELGDLLLQVVFHAQMAREKKLFDFAEVAEGICDKLVRRHPHVFGDAEIRSAEEQTAAWENMKSQERSAQSGTEGSALDGVTKGLPEWLRALKLQQKAARVGFDWPDIGPVLAKLYEEIQEVQEELGKADKSHERLIDEVGDVLFVCVNLARHLKVDFGQALRRGNAKFERRFRCMEALVRQDGLVLENLDLVRQDAYWDRVKAGEIVQPSQYADT